MHSKRLLRRGAAHRVGPAAADPRVPLREAAAGRSQRTFPKGLVQLPAPRRRPSREDSPAKLTAASEPFNRSSSHSCQRLDGICLTGVRCSA